MITAVTLILYDLQSVLTPVILYKFCHFAVR